MSDVHDVETRSYNMSKIKSANTKPELFVRKYLHSKGLRYRLHNRNLPGTPDIILPKYQTVIFVNGCFWHGHTPCKYFVLPKTRTEWWREKIHNTINRDKNTLKQLKNLGWRTYVVWECELKPDKANKTLENLFISIKTALHNK